jgi:5-methylcytosine-specific restriction endonuclease McrA
MARSKSDISNSAIRIFLQDVGKYYDEARGFDPFMQKLTQKDELLEFFQHQCCYCGIELNRKSLSFDHLIPMNKANLGLHAWGNVVACCQSCNNEKQQTNWVAFLEKKADRKLVNSRKEKIQQFVIAKNHDPNLDLHEYADNLYEDVGAVAMTLIHLRYKQAENGIKKMLKNP